MSIIDISWPITPAMTGYKDGDMCEFTPLCTFGYDGVRSTEIRLHSHVGTHVDAPSHFLADGVPIDQIRLEQLCGPCIVVETEGEDPIELDDLKQLLAKRALKDQIILLKTNNSYLEPNDPFDYEFVDLAPDAAQWLAQAGIRAIGIDYLGIERGEQGYHPVHQAFLGRSIPIIEGLRLSHVQPGSYTLICLPLRLVGIDSAPARAVLLPPVMSDIP